MKYDLNNCQWSEYEFSKSNSDYTHNNPIHNFTRRNLSMPIDMNVLVYLGNMTSDSGSFLESGYLVIDSSLNNIFTGEIGCYATASDFSWDNYGAHLSAIFVGY